MIHIRLFLPLATLHFVGWIEPISGYFGFRFTQLNLHFISSIAKRNPTLADFRTGPANLNGQL
jgi:hypothetical protein